MTVAMTVGATKIQVMYERSLNSVFEKTEDEGRAAPEETSPTDQAECET